MIHSSYQQLITSEGLQEDAKQLAAVNALDALAKQLAARQPAFSLYIYGPVGRGKSMLMDLFYRQVPIAAKTRLHYHHFMQQVHSQLTTYQGSENPLNLVAKEWSEKYRVICLDEFIVEDIGDAMLLANLWTALFDLGTLLVTTSNTPPKELYRGGLARHRFEPFIELLQQQCRIISLDSGIDYRRLKHHDFPFYFINQPRQTLRLLVERSFGKTRNIDKIRIMNRDMQCLWRNQHVIGFDFWNLCSGPRSQRDYMALADQFKVIVVDAVPQFSGSQQPHTAQGVEDGYQRQLLPQFSHLDNEARRFIALVDECYDRGCLIITNAASAIDKLYQGELLEFPFQRCISRLIEMQQWDTRPYM